MTKTFYWISNKMDTVHTLKICNNGKVVATVRNLNGRKLRECVNSLKSEGYVHE